ncbi:hypothetical protein niasHS_005162 [Heterodera schachtii]|uniref:Uncharacterized protein n=1 Tax=Heterodera schachtii TaxID=97005 RepID=A0ABD2JRK9_HETSC
MIPAVNFTLRSNGITVSSERLSTPRLIPFDIPSKFRHYKPTEAEMDFMVTKDGVTVWCTRINGTAFVPKKGVYLMWSTDSHQCLLLRHAQRGKTQPSSNDHTLLHAKPKKQQPQNEYQELIDSLNAASTLFPSQPEQHSPIAHPC